MLLWLGIYQWISFKELQLESFNTDLRVVHNQSIESNRFLQYFIVKGFHEPEFYVSGNQKDIDKFLFIQSECLKKLRQLYKRSKGRSANLEANLLRLIKITEDLTQSVHELKQLYFKKGFKDYGWEGVMRRYAHMLEDSGMVKETDILMLRRHEKDFLMRGETVYAEAFFKRANEIIARYPTGSQAKSTLQNYVASFKALETYSNQLGIFRDTGKYLVVQELLYNNGNQYLHTQAETATFISNLQNNFKYTLAVISLIMIGLAIFLSLRLSKILTRDISELNRRMLSFVRSHFKEFDDGHTEEPFSPAISEVDQLNRQFILLKGNLKTTLEELEQSLLNAQKASDYKSTFLANMSHEIRTPLNGIIGMLYILKDSPLTSDQEKHIETIEFSANHLMDILNMILDYSKIEAGKIDLEKIPFDLPGDADKLVRLFENRAKEKGLVLTLNCNADHIFMEMGDPLRLQQILINLLNNAIKFTEQGTINLNIEVIKINANTLRTRFEVKDSGIGIKEERLNDLFQAFRQGDSSITRNYGGTGLGLTIAYELVNLMGGELKATSKENAGSLFYFEIDLGISKKLRARMHVTEKREDPGQSMHILLAEDNPINQKVMEMMLKKMGHRVMLAADGQEAVRLYHDNDYDVILMDIQMPVMDGMKATLRIKDSEKYNFSPIPVIAVTANAFNEDREKAFAVGMDDFLTKPVRPLELENMLFKFSLHLR